MNKKYFYLIGMLVIIAVVFFWPQSTDLQVLDEVLALDFASAEEQVGDKIRRLVDSTESDPQNADLWGKLAMNLYIHDYKALAVDCFQKAYQLNPSEFRWPYFCGVALDELNQPEAIQWYEISTEMDSQYPPLGIKLGNRFVMNRQLDKAEPIFRSIIDTGIEIPHAYLGLAKIAIEKEDLHVAKNYLESALQQAPEFREAHALMAEIYRRQGDRQRAEQIFAKMKDLPDRLDLSDPIYYQMVEEGVSSFWCQVRGNNLLKKGKVLAAEKEFIKALHANPNQSSYTSLGYVYQLQKKYDDAIQQYEAALQLDPNYIGAINNLGIILFEQGKTDRAIAMLEKGRQNQPDNPDIYLNLGTFYKKQGADTKAVQHFKEGRKRAPNDYRFAYQLAWLYAGSANASVRDGQQAMQLAEVVCEYHKYQNASSLDLLAAAYAENGQYNDAVDTAQKARQIALEENMHSLVAKIEQRLQEYRQGRPYRSD